MDMLHIVYVAEAMLGAPIERVSAWVTARTDGAPVEDIALARFETRPTPPSSTSAGASGWAASRCPARLGRIEVTYRGRRERRRSRPIERLVVHGRSGRAEVTGLPFEDGVQPLIADLADAIRAGRPPIATGAQGAHILEATLAVYASGATGRTWQLPLVAGRADLRARRRRPVRARARPDQPDPRASGSSASADRRSSDGPLPLHGFRRQADASRRPSTWPSRSAARPSRSPPAGSPRRRHMRIDDLLLDAGKRRAFADAFAQSRAPDRARSTARPGRSIRSSATSRCASSSAKVIRLAAELGVDKIVTMSGTPGDGPARNDRQLGLVSVAGRRPGTAGPAMGRGDPVLAGAWPVRRRPRRPADRVRAPSAAPGLQRADAAPDARRRRAGDRRQRGSVAHVLAADGPARGHPGARTGGPPRPPQGHAARARRRSPSPACSTSARSRTPSERAWIFRTIGRGHDADFWSAFVAELRAVGYDDVLSIENEDVTQPAVEGVVEAAAFMNAILLAG